jgi:hypothetical protein
MNPITGFFEKIINYDWNSFNLIEDMFRQSNEWEKLLNQFDEILLNNTDYVLKNSAIIKKEINSFNPIFCNLNIKGKLHIIVNRFSISGYLTEKVNTIIFLNTADENLCNCLLRKHLQMNPNDDKIIKIRKDFDGYYYSDIYKCKECNEIWVLENLDDGTARWEKHYG